MPKTANLTDSAKLTWSPKKTFSLEFTVSWEEVQKTYDHVLGHFVDEVKLKGFRQGKAPKDLVEKSVDQSKIYGEVVNHILPNAYAKAIATHKLRPAVSPKVTIVSAEDGKPWQFKAESCELPEVKLGNYQQEIKGALSAGKLWKPGDPKEDKQKALTESQKLNLISKALIDSVKLELSDLLVESERDRLLSRLLDQIQKLGLTIDQYASSTNKTVEQLKQEYTLTAANTLKLEIILQAIADDKKLEASDKEIDEMINQTGDEKLKKQLNTPQERAYIATVVRKRKVIDYLLSL